MATEGAGPGAAAGGVAAVDLYWLPLGAGGHVVRLNGRAYEAVMARLGRRPAFDLYHSALQVRVPEATFVVEQAPVPDRSGEQRGVVAEGAVGSSLGGAISDLPLRDPSLARRAASRTSPRPWTARGD